MALWLDTMLEPMAYFRPRRGYLATPVLVLLNIAVWVLMVASGVHYLDPDGDTLLAWGGNLDSRVAQGEYWRLLTCTFLHSGIIHLFMNMIVLSVIGIELEKRTGSIRYTIAYLFSGIGASIASAVFNDGIVSVGASGAVFGMFGTFLSLMLLNAVPRKVKKNLIWVLLAFVVVNFINITQQGVDHWAHFGGLISGLVIGAILSFGIKAQPQQEEIQADTPAPEAPAPTPSEEAAPPAVPAPDPDNSLPPETP